MEFPPDGAADVIVAAYGWPALLFLLVAAHYLCDFPWQGDFLAEAKDRHTLAGRRIWPHALTGHALIHGGAVLLLTGSLALGLAETAAHWATDWMKGEKRIGFHADQAIHLVCKALWVAVLAVSA